MNTRTSTAKQKICSKSRYISAAALLTVLCVLLWFGCSDSPTIAGSVTEGGNTDVSTATVSGMMVDRRGTGIADAQIFLRPRGYLPDTGDVPSTNPKGILRYRKFDAHSNDDGSFRIDSVLPGAYVLSAFHEDSLGIMNTITIEDKSYSFHSPLILSDLGGIRGNIRFSESVPQDVLIRIHGLERNYRVALEGQNSGFVIDRIPPGICRMDIVPSQQAAYGSRRIENIQVISGEIASVDTISFSTFGGEDYSTWRYSKTISCNTTRSGVYMREDITWFPLLVELNPDVFDFGQALANGDDLRFSNKDGSHLYYEIEEYNADSGRASIWVLVDTLSANSITDIVMHWGKQDAVNHSQGTGVFSAQAGYNAVYHLNESGDVFRNAVNGLTQAEGKLFDGSEAVAGVAGGADSLDGRNDRITIQAIQGEPSRQMTVSIWTKIATWRESTYLLSKSLNDPESIINSFAFKLNDSSLLSFHLSVDGQEASVFSRVPARDEWIHIAGVFDGSAVRLFINGEMAGNSALSGTIDWSTMPVVIGYCLEGPERHLNAVVDEFRIQQVARSADWIKLCHANLKNPERLISLE
ncbi:MAG: DUF2341 domain-containing protein [Chitinivibrionales bacterium]